MKTGINLALLISGGGTTAEAVIKAYKFGRLKGIDSIMVFSSSNKSAGTGKAKKLGISVITINKKDCQDAKEFSVKLLKQLEKYKINLVSQNGWIPLTSSEIIKKFQGRIFNQHPGPLDPGRPDFGGKGMYGRRVTCARLIYLYLTSEPYPWTECTTHYASEVYDNGDLISTKRLYFSLNSKKLNQDEMLTNPQLIISETEKIQAQLLSLEHENVIETLEEFTQNTVGDGFIRSQPLIPKENIEILKTAKSLAIKLFPNG